MKTQETIVDEIESDQDGMTRKAKRPEEVDPRGVAYFDFSPCPAVDALSTYTLRSDSASTQTVGFADGMVPCNFPRKIRRRK